ncbi:DM13 domain-containing protein [Ferrimonas senticii]|uniref:DM13 domain-containing protein n=1 Tax=Ferrimonas senticii TaxID=394566 RepID=UPI000425D248|nr:DM13 domain-containing protein [Ferrimonas senticii]
MRALGLWLSHIAVGVVGLVGGMYLLPILTAPEAPSGTAVQQVVSNSDYQASFARDRIDSDFLHWGEGTLSISGEQIAFRGQLAAGPDYHLYLSPRYVETETEFAELKAQMVDVGLVKSFDGFVLPLPPGIEVGNYAAAIVWCESFGEFITSGRLIAVDNN